MTYKAGSLTGGGSGGGPPAWAAITGKPSTFPPEAHTQAISTITGLQGALDGKQVADNYTVVGHTHAAADITDLPAGGSDPWTYIKLVSDFVTGSATAVDITGMAFTPAANTQYEFEACLMLRTALAATGPRPGLAWPTGGTDGVARIDTPSSATAATIVQGNISASLLAAVGGLPNTTGSYPAYIAGTFRAGATPTGNIRLQLASETAASNVTARAGSYLKYRVI